MKQKPTNPPESQEKPQANLLIEPSTITKPSLGTKTFILFVCAFYIAAATSEKLFLKVLVEQLTVNNALSQKIVAYENLETLYRRTAARVAEYTKLRAQQISMKDKVGFVVNNVQPDIELSEIRVQDTSFNIKAKGKNLLAFSKMIVAYLDSPYVSEIYLKSVTLNSGTQLFDVEFGGGFK